VRSKAGATVKSIDCFLDVKSTAGMHERCSVATDEMRRLTQGVNMATKKPAKKAAKKAPKKKAAKKAKKI
jgi:hypothetical protein